MVNVHGAKYGDGSGRVAEASDGGSEEISEDSALIKYHSAFSP